MYSPFGCRISPKSIGVSANFRVGIRLLLSRITFTSATAAITGGILFMTAGETPCNHKHHLTLLLINSVAPINRLNKASASGYEDIISFLSTSE